MLLGYLLGIWRWEGEKARGRNELEYWGVVAQGEEVEGGAWSNYLHGSLFQAISNSPFAHLS